MAVTNAPTGLIASALQAQGNQGNWQGVYDYAQQAGWSPTDTANYVNQTFGTNIGAGDVSNYISGQGWSPLAEASNLIGTNPTTGNPNAVFANVQEAFAYDDPFIPNVGEFYLQGNPQLQSAYQSYFQNQVAPTAPGKTFEQWLGEDIVTPGFYTDNLNSNLAAKQASLQGIQGAASDYFGRSAPWANAAEEDAAWQRLMSGVAPYGAQDYFQRKPYVAPPVLRPTIQPANTTGGLEGNWGGASANFGGTGDGVQLFNVDLSPPFSGANWRNTILNLYGLSDADLYAKLKDFAGSGDYTLSSGQRDLNLNPGEVMALYEKAVQYANANGLQVPLLPASTNAARPYVNYGFGPQQQLYGRNIGGQTVVNPLAAYAQQIQAQRNAPVAAASGGSIGALNDIYKDPTIKRYLRGGGGGQDDDVPAVLSNGEYVMDADVVSALGDGNNEAGAAKLDKMRENIRKHKRSASHKSIPPAAKAPEQYLKGK
jgi:hypothetical protein